MISGDEYKLSFYRRNPNLLQKNCKVITEKRKVLLTWPFEIIKNVRTKCSYYHYKAEKERENELGKIVLE
jgi:hypothetical protein